MKTPALRIVLIGGGNLAFHLSKALAGLPAYPLIQVYARSAKQAKAIGTKARCLYTHKLQDIETKANLYILCISDDAIGEVAETLSPYIPASAIVVHTAGSKPANVLKPWFANYGVIYPLQTFTREKKFFFNGIPLFITAANKNTKDVLLFAACLLSQEVHSIDDQSRIKLHLAAVLVNNFTNYLYHLTGQFLHRQKLELNLFFPLMEETVAKIKIIPPGRAQTGPARRHDKEVIEQHLALLRKSDQEELETIYRLFSNLIWKKYDSHRI